MEDTFTQGLRSRPARLLPLLLLLMPLRPLRRLSPQRLLRPCCRLLWLPRCRLLLLPRRLLLWPPRCRLLLLPRCPLLVPPRCRLLLLPRCLLLSAALQEVLPPLGAPQARERAPVSARLPLHCRVDDSFGH